MAELWYNTNYDFSLKMTPFETLYGYQPRHLPFGPYLDSNTLAADNLVRDRQAMLQILQEHLQQHNKE